jgi:hypothetical protein
MIPPSSKEVLMRRSPTGGLALAAILIAGLVAAGCGSSNENSSSSTPTPTKAEFLKKGNAICKKGNQQIGKSARTLFPNKGAKPTKAELTKFANDTLIPSVQSQINQIRSLGAPAGDKAQVNAIVSSAQSALNKGKKDPILLTSNGPGPFKKANQLANSYGLTVCGAS